MDRRIAAGLAPTLLAVAAILASACAAQPASPRPEAIPGPGSILDGFPLGPRLDAAPDAAAAGLAVAALDQRLPGHAAIVSKAPFHEDIGLIYGSGAARSGSMTVWVFALADGTYRAAGVYCTVGGCQPWPVYRP